MTPDSTFPKIIVPMSYNEEQQLQCTNTSRIHQMSISKTKQNNIIILELMAMGFNNHLSIFSVYVAYEFTSTQPVILNLTSPNENQLVPTTSALLLILTNIAFF